jgi:hypothetical protein
MNISEVSAAEHQAVERDTGKTDSAAAVENLAVGGMGFEGAGEGRCGSSEQAICGT